MLVCLQKCCVMNLASLSGSHKSLTNQTIHCRAGAELHENCAVKDATFNKKEGLWKVFLDGSETTYKVSDCAMFR